MDGFKPECKLCGNIILVENYKVLEDVIKNIFDIQLLKLTLDNDTQCLICTTCCSKLLAALNFKSACLYTDNSIIRYVGFENPKQVDLKDIYAKEENNKQGSIMLDDLEICRLCLQPMGNDHKTIQEVPIEIIQIYIPEINFALSTNPVICLKCQDALCVHGTFIRNCLDVQKQRNIKATDVGGMIFSSPCIKFEEIEIKYENEEKEKWDTSLYSQSRLIDTEEINILCDVDLKETNAESIVVSCKNKEGTGKTPSERNRKIKYGNKNQVIFTRTDLKVQKYHKDPLEVRMYKCDECAYKSLRMDRLKQHQLRHKNRSEVRVFKCDECDYKTIQKGGLRIHRLIHKDPSEVEMFQCDECDYKTIHRNLLKHHQLRHKDPSEVLMFYCGECDYKSIQRHSLKRHQLRHKAPSEVRMFRCDECDYRTIHKYSLQKHQLIHKDLSEVQVFNCDQCDYNSILKGNFLRHQLIHKDPSELQMFQCDDCDFKTINKYYLKQHQLGHKDPSEVQMFKCDRCNYKSVHKGNLAKHTKIHQKC